MRNAVVRYLRLASVALVAGCSAAGTEPPPADRRPASVQLTAAQTTLVPGEHTALTWLVKDPAGVTMTGQPVSLASLDTSLAVIEGSEVVARAAGVVVIRATADAVSGQVQVVIVPGAMIGPAGGTIAAGGTVSLAIPPGALAATTAIRLEESSTPFIDPTGFGLSGIVYTVAPASLTFATPATLQMTVPFGGPLGLPAGGLGIRRLAGGAWQNAAAAAIDTVTRIATAAISAGGTYSAGRLIPAAPCTAPEYRAFDYWLGSWNVSNSGSNVGTNDITLEPGGCAILESYRDIGGTVGYSISFYEPVSGRWYQTWHDNQRLVLGVAGGVDGTGNIVMKTTGNANVFQQWSWIREGLNVRQVAANTNNGGATFGAPVVNLLYVLR